MNHQQRSDTPTKSTKRVVTPSKGNSNSRLPVKLSTTPIGAKKNQKSTYLVAPLKSNKAGFENIENGRNKVAAQQIVNTKNHLQDADLNQLNNRKTSSSPSQVQEMIDRFRYAKPMPSEQREKPTFWWNDDDVSTEFSDELDDEVKQSIGGEGMIKNLRDLDLKARELIDKSEFTLSEKMISSEGLGSASNTSTITSNSQVSSTVLEEAVFRPDFVKYIETKNRLDTDAYKMNSNEDILQKWRLRRKLEETKSQALQQNFNIDELLGRKAHLFALQTHHTQQQTALSKPPPEVVDTPQTQTISPKTTTTTSTMTIPAKSETACQTSIDTTTTTSSRHRQHNYMHEKPTRDEPKVVVAVTSSSSSSSRVEQHKFIKTRKSSKSPTYKSTSTSIQDKTLSSIVQRSNISDLTRISSINQVHNSIESFINNDDDNETTIVNNTNIVLYQQQEQQQAPSQQHQHVVSNNSVISSNLIFDSTVYESDELLNILFKKLFFYQSKLDDIEALIESK